MRCPSSGPERMSDTTTKSPPKPPEALAPQTVDKAAVVVSMSPTTLHQTTIRPPTYAHAPNSLISNGLRQGTRPLRVRKA